MVFWRVTGALSVAKTRQTLLLHAEDFIFCRSFSGQGGYLLSQRMRSRFVARTHANAIGVRHKRLSEWILITVQRAPYQLLSL